MTALNRKPPPGFLRRRSTRQQTELLSGHPTEGYYVRVEKNGGCWDILVVSDPVWTNSVSLYWRLDCQYWSHFKPHCDDEIFLDPYWRADTGGDS